MLIDVDIPSLSSRGIQLGEHCFEFVNSLQVFTLPSPNHSMLLLSNSSSDAKASSSKSHSSCFLLSIEAMLMN